VYVLTSKCNETCNKAQKFVQTKDVASISENDELSRIEYGYGSGYINGYVAKEKLCFAKDKSAPCLSDVKILEAD